MALKSVFKVDFKLVAGGTGLQSQVEEISLETLVCIAAVWRKPRLFHRFVLEYCLALLVIYQSFKKFSD